jgi:hypothetical protein
MERGKSPRNARFGNGDEGEMIPSIERIERWIKENMEVSDYEVEKEGREIVIWMKDTYFDNEDLEKLSRILKIRKWRIDGINCKVMLEVRGYGGIMDEREMDERAEKLGSIMERVKEEMLRRIPFLEERDLDFFPFIDSMAILVRVKGREATKIEYDIMREIAEENGLEMSSINIPVKGILRRRWDSFYLLFTRGEG